MYEVCRREVRWLAAHGVRAGIHCTQPCRQKGRSGTQIACLGEGGLARRVSVSEQEVHLVSLAQTGSDRWGATSSRLPSAQVASILS